MGRSEPHQNISVLSDVPHQQLDHTFGPVHAAGPPTRMILEVLMAAKRNSDVSVKPLEIPEPLLVQMDPVKFIHVKPGGQIQPTVAIYVAL